MAENQNHSADKEERLATIIQLMAQGVERPTQIYEQLSEVYGIGRKQFDKELQEAKKIIAEESHIDRQKLLTQSLMRHNEMYRKLCEAGKYSDAHRVQRGIDALFGLNEAANITIDVNGGMAWKIINGNQDDTD